MKKIGLFYAPMGGSTEKIAKLVAAELSESKVDVFGIKSDEYLKIGEYDQLLLGIATVGKDTWNSNHPGSGWDKALAHINKLDFKGKTIAIFGLGNSITYPDHFVDAMGILANKLQQQGANIVGQTPVEGYDFNESEAVIDGEFMGLPIDEDNEPELSLDRVKNWIKLISNDMNI